MRQSLAGLRVIDLSVNAPGPFASRMLADLGAEVTEIAKPAGAPDYAAAGDDPMLSGRGGPNDALALGKRRLVLDLKSEEGRAALLAQADDADVLISEMRPGKLDALGLGWPTLQERNPRLVLCEITGYGGDGPLAARAGHDINYAAISGVLSTIRDGAGKPIPPQNLLGDYAAGGALSVAGILAALLERSTTGRGRHLTVSMSDGIRFLATDIAAATLLAGHAEADWRGTLGGEMPTYACYRTSDDEWMAVGALEPKFVAILAERLDWAELPALVSRKANWPEARAGLARRFALRTRDEWETVFEGTDACVTPVRSLAEGGVLPDLAQVLGAKSTTKNGPTA